jgi:uncharacterized coiled-coil DUF342 family protein
MPPKAKADAKPKAKGEPKKKKENVEEEETKMKAPDREAFQEKMEKMQGEIENLQKEKREINQQISDRSGGRDEFFTQRDAIKAQLNAINEELEQYETKKSGINEGVVKKKQEQTDARNQINKMKRSIGYDSETKIDDRIATIEFKLWTESISLKEEKKYLQEIQELKRNRPKVSQVQSLEANLTAGKESGASKEELNTIGAEMFQLRENRRAISKQLKELVESRTDQLGDFSGYQKKREELNEQIKAKIDAKNQMRDEFRAEENAHRDHLNAERTKRQDKLREEREKQMAERQQKAKQAKADKLDEQPYLNEITLIEQTISFCKSLVQDKGPQVKEETEKKDLNVFEGAEVLVKKEDREEEFYFQPTKGKKKGGKKTKEAGAAKPIKHNAETFRLFDKLKIEAPITTDDVPSRLEQLEKQLEDFRQKVKDWEVTREEKKRRILNGEDNEEEEEEEAQPEKAEAAKEDDKDAGEGEEQEAAADAAEEGKAED